MINLTTTFLTTEPAMLLIGLTGGIGAGKTEVSDYLHSRYGIKIIDADVISRELLQKGSSAYHETQQNFPANVFDAEGNIDRKALRTLIFNDEAARQKLEGIIHPRVRSEIKRQIDCNDSAYCILSAPLLIEAGMNDLISRLLVVDCNKDLRIQRVVARDDCKVENIEKIMARQLDDKQRLDCADDIVINNNNRANLTDQLDQLHKKYLDLTHQASHNPTYV